MHEEGFTVELVAGGARFRRPDGRAIEEAPALPRVAGDGVAALGRRIGRREVARAAETLPSWEGGTVDYGWAVQALRGLEVATAGGRVSSPAPECA